MYIDGQALKEPYAVYRPSLPDSYRDDFPRLVSTDASVIRRWIEMRSLVSNGELTVPAGSYFVLGTTAMIARYRYWGLVLRAVAIVGKAVSGYFSAERCGWGGTAGGGVGGRRWGAAR